ncbi:MAG: hypothetical protein E7069_05035 [Bacteroidales bacterium]|nr:hypothetical protein [Bacteroidales bacterium]
MAELMTQNSRKQNSLLKKSPLIFLVLITASCNFLHQARMEKMQGVWILDEEKSIVKRNTNCNIQNIFSITKGNIDLPHVLLGKMDFDSTMTKESRDSIRIKRTKKRNEDCHGTYYFPDSNADSVVFEAPNNPLVGRYKIQIFDDGQYRFMILSNDSTYLVCSQNTFHLW